MAIAGRLDLTGDLMGPIALGVLSAGAAVIEQNANVNKTGGVFMQQASLYGDLALGGYAVINHMQGLGMPRSGAASLATAGAGIALISKRATEWIGSTVLGMSQFRGAGKYAGRVAGPARRMSLRSPGAAVETSVLPRKRQFFSVT